MATIPFNETLDKITEREVVFDFVSRLSYGYDATDPDDRETIIIPQKTLLKDSLEKIMMQFPNRISKNLNEIHTGIFGLDTVQVQYNLTIPFVDSKAPVMLLAYSERTGLDLTDIFTVSTENNETTYTLLFDAPCTNTDTIKYYFIYE